MVSETPIFYVPVARSAGLIGRDAELETLHALLSGSGEGRTHGWWLTKTRRSRRQGTERAPGVRKMNKKGAGKPGPFQLVRWPRNQAAWAAPF